MNRHTDATDTCYYVVDTEASAPKPFGAMLTCGLVRLDRTLGERFYGRFCPPANTRWNPQAIEAHGITPEMAATFPSPEVETARMLHWLRKTSGGRKVRLITDNPAFDASLLRTMTLEHADDDIFGHSARRIGDLYCGLVRDFNANEEWKARFRDADSHTHDALEDAVSNARALIRILDFYPMEGFVLED